MKKRLFFRTIPYTLFVGLMLLIHTKVAAILPIGGYTKRYNTSFQRTYQHQAHLVSRKHRTKVKQKRRQTSYGRNSSVGVAISNQDFANHFTVGSTRTVQFTPSGISIFMDVKGIDETGMTPQVWEMPNFNNFSIRTEQILQVPPAETGFQEAYPDATHAFYIPRDSIYEFYDLNEEELLLLGFSFEEGQDTFIIDDLITLAPVPIAWDSLFEVEDVYIYDGDYEIDSLAFTQSFDVVAFGTLNTYDDGPVDALKMHYEEVTVEYLNGEIVPGSKETERRVVWYSVNGHFVRGTLAEGAAFTGQTTFTLMEYQKDINTCVDSFHVDYLGIDLGNFKAGNQLTSNGTLRGAIGQNVSFAAGQAVTLKSGFHAPAGSAFTAKIEGCATQAITPPTIPGKSEPKLEKILALDNFEVDINDLGQAILTASLSTQNNAPLKVERSIDGIQFTPIGTIGESIVNEYQFTDKQPAQSTNYYRLQQTANNGQILHSEVISALVAGNSKANPVVLLYPNPGKDQVWFSQPANYELFDMHGRLLTKGHASGALDVSMLVAGKYYVRVNGAEMHVWVKQ